MKKLIILIPLMMVIVLGLSSFIGKPIEDAKKVNWMTIEEAIAASQKNPKKIIIDCYTDWCGWCKRMDKATFQHPDIAEYINDNYYAVKFNAEQKEPITIGDKIYKFVASGRRGYHELAAVLMGGKMSYPTIVFLGTDFANLSVAPGYKDPTTMDKMLRYFNEDHYKTTAWAIYDKSTKSKVK